MAGDEFSKNIPFPTHSTRSTIGALIQHYAFRRTRLGNQNAKYSFAIRDAGS
jgi:hypothetical protein